MFELQILIPVLDNDGDAFGAEHFAAFEAAVIDSFGGFTLYPSTAVGGWRNDAGREFRDATRVYGIAVPSIAAGDKVAALVRFSKALFAQEAIFVRYLGVIEIL
jgi:hypothetical protein